MKNLIIRSISILISTLILTSTADCKTLVTGVAGKYKSVRDASKYAVPGDTILIKPGEYLFTENISNLHGQADKWIVIRAEIAGKSIYKAGTYSFHLTDPRYIKIEGLVFTGQTGNGFNIDDGGTPETTAQFVIMENCTFPDINATGNNDELKMSGVDDFEIRHCTFQNGSKGGSLIDMVGCHNGLITENIFENGGSNAVQVKGGSKNILIARNRFIKPGERGVNIGGSTGTQFFRPHSAPFEASGIKVWTNIFNGGIVPVAYVGAVNCEVVNNTIINPEKWILRILQENRTEGMLQCSKNIFRNNIIVFTTSVSVPVNIGPGTDPASFIFSNNLWYLSGANSWTGPELPVKETGQILNADPMFIDDEYRLKSSSPAIGKGYHVQMPESDFFGRDFSTKRAIGAIEF